MIEHRHGEETKGQALVPLPEPAGGSQWYQKEYREELSFNTFMRADSEMNCQHRMEVLVKWLVVAEVTIRRNKIFNGENGPQWHRRFRRMHC